MKDRGSIAQSLEGSDVCESVHINPHLQKERVYNNNNMTECIFNNKLDRYYNTDLHLVAFVVHCEGIFCQEYHPTKYNTQILLTKMR